VPRLVRFTDLHPRLRVELIIEDRRQDLIVENVDIVLRFGKLTDSSALARRIGAWPLVVAAAPSYIASKGTPRSPSDLAAHDFIVAGPVAGKSLNFSKEGKSTSIQVEGRFAISAAEVAVNAAAAGLGIVVATVPSLERELERGEMVRLLADWDVGEIEAHALFPSGQAPKPAARAFMEFLIASLATT
jgi:DNA-binding transcriptional LysR family regulator